MEILRRGSVGPDARVVKLDRADRGNRESVATMHADARSWIGFFVGASLAGLATAVGHIGTLVYLMDVHPGVAGWVQAVGSIIGIATAIAVPAWQSERGERLQRADRAQRELSFASAAYAAVSEGASVAASIYATCKTHPQGFNRMSVELLIADVLQSMNAIPMHEAPRSDIFSVVKLARIQINQIHPILGTLEELAVADELTSAHLDLLRARANRLIEIANDAAQLFPAADRPGPIDLEIIETYVDLNS
jgi:hypothetical protein